MPDAGRTDLALSPVARFFLWCAGSDRQALDRTPRSEAIKQMGYGTLVVVPAVLALFAMTYALSTLTDNPWIYGAGGVVWALVVFSFDRFILSTFRKSDSVWRDVTSAVFLTRLAFAAFVGVLVAHPLVLLYFDESIEERLARDLRLERGAVRASFDARIQELTERGDELRGEVRQRERDRDAYQAQLVDEIDGIVSGRTTGIPGRGASAAEKARQLAIAQRELDADRERNLQRVGVLEARIEELRRESRGRQAALARSDDYLARTRALEALSAEAPPVRRVKWFLILFFVFVDTLPLLFKGFTPAGAYDRHLRLAEARSERSAEAGLESLERVLYPYMVVDQENRFLADQGYRKVGDSVQRYRQFLAELSRHQAEFLHEWQRQQELLAAMEEGELKQRQLGYMENLRRTSIELLDQAAARFRQGLAWESSQPEG